MYEPTAGTAAASGQEVWNGQIVYVLRYVTGCVLQHSTLWMLFKYQWGRRLQIIIKLSIIWREFVSKVVCLDQFVMISQRRIHKAGLSVKAT